MAIFFSLYALVACSQEENEAEAALSMAVKNYQGHLFVDFFEDGKDTQIGFYPCGVNRLFGIAEVSYFPGRAAHHRGEAANRFLSCTDWIGPYYVCGFSNKQGGLPVRFTGGWHGSNGDGTGEPTAAAKDLTIRVDGHEMSGNFEKSCDQVDLVVTNLIQGYDYALSKKELLRETVQYDITVDRKIAVCVCIEALDDVVIQRYYGLQSQNFSIFDSVSYASNDRVCHTAPVKTNSNSPQVEGVNAIILTGASNQHRLRLVLNNHEGLGTAEYLAPGLPRAFSASYGKSYFNLVNGRELVLEKGEKVFWEGAYYWD
ncbi:MAG: hypothetical protein F9K10_04865 [Paludibacter sp.]|nr:MAG: hypothetical protein F9K10_04865 [Paludibacter sp.]